MAIPITVPRLGWSMEEGTFVEWLKRDGETVQPGQPLFVLESDKAAENIDSLDGGILRIPADGPQPGDVVKVGQTLAYLVVGEESFPRSLPRLDQGKDSLPTAPINVGEESLPRSAGERGKTRAISPRARRVARELGVDPRALQGSGRDGRVRERDVRAAQEAGSEGRFIPHTTIRKLIAARMVAGTTEAAPVTLITKADATNLVTLRRQLQTAASDDVAPTYTDLIVNLAAASLREHLELQSQWRADGLFIPGAIHIAVAVDTEAGLLAPVVRNADRLTIQELAAQTRTLIQQARDGKLSAEQMRGGTFTVTNLGMFGIDAFTPIIALPQCAVLGIGRIVREPAVVDEQIVPRDMVTLSLTFDHRVVDGAPAARFLDAVRRGIEELLAT